MNRIPVIGLTADVKQISPHPYHCVGDKYLRAVADAAGGVPVVFPALGEGFLEPLLDRVDGVLLTGSYANIHPSRYRGGEPYPGSPQDLDRDQTNLQLIPAVLARGIPLLGVCRGFQEINVALGGTLHQKVQEVAGFDDHREIDDATLDVQYGPSHPVHITPGGALAALTDETRPMVNSLHGQGVDRLADGLTIQARAPDGLVEAFTVDAARNFALAVQWHPEWQPLRVPFYAAIWRAFGDACRAFAVAGDRTERVA